MHGRAQHNYNGIQSQKNPMQKTPNVQSLLQKPTYQYLILIERPIADLLVSNLDIDQFGFRF
jgi:hypothetical protein